MCNVKCVDMWYGLLKRTPCLYIYVHLWTSMWRCSLSQRAPSSQKASDRICMNAVHWLDSLDICEPGKKWTQKFVSVVLSTCLMCMGAVCYCFIHSLISKKKLAWNFFTMSAGGRHWTEPMCSVQLCLSMHFQLQCIFARATWSRESVTCRNS